MYALFAGAKQIGRPFPTEKDVWEAALIDGLVQDIPVADESGGQVVPAGYHVAEVEKTEVEETEVEETCDPLPDWKLPREIS